MTEAVPSIPQPDQVQEVQPINISSSLLPTIIVSSLIGAVSGGLLVYALIVNNLLPIETEKASNSSASLEQSRQAQSLTPGTVDPSPSQQSSIISLDDTWNRYENYELGFAINVPKTLFAVDGAECIWDGESYRPGKGATIPVKIIEKENAVILSSAYLYDLTEPQETAEGKTNFLGCEKMEATADEFPQSKVIGYFFQHWLIETSKVSSQDELAVYVKNKYGTTCSVDPDSLTAETPSGFSFVGISGDGLDLAETNCPINFMYVLAYQPSTGRIVNWNRGQAMTFYKTPSGAFTGEGWDEQVQSSFEFL